MSYKAIQTALSKVSESGVIQGDLGGKHGHQPTIDPQIKQSVIDFINSIPKIESHYLRAQTKRQYISSEKSLADIYRDYKQLREKDGLAIATSSTFNRIFNTEFNISFFVPNKDQCDLCERYKNSDSEEKRNLSQEYEQHQKEKVLARNEKDNDKSRADGTIVAVYDLQAVLQIPKGQISLFFYKSRINCFNFTISDLRAKEVMCYFWDETEGKRGPIEIGSCILDYVKAQVLLAVGVWLQQMGCSSSQSLQLVENIIRDHFYLNTTNLTALKSLASTAPQFVCNFITAVTELYMQDTQKPIKLPPKNLLEVITFWVYSTPTLCMSAQLNAAALPSGAIPMAAVTPLAGIVRWCALAPLYIDEDAEMLEIPPKKIKIEGERGVLKTVKLHSESQLYIQLQLGLLQSLRAWRRRGPPAAVAAQRITALLPPVREYAQKLLDRGCKINTDMRLQDSLDRIGQAVQVALANGCVYGNISSLLASLDTLPENRLLRIVIKTHRQGI
ncbi:unnamed protein product [Parnassius apollo]|uniref:(apollo) hypothetical protein n=1 Tax=Parnassius apollo TaxID=110799 RepID=A0A8S3W7Z9_PARAO|nr:unnamed protein product [Parnassius apollo]